MTAPRYVAAIDLGSHTFCLVIARAHGVGAGFRTVDRVKERVALMSGVDAESGELDRATLDRALAVVRRLGARVRHMPPEDVRAVGTSALRVTPGLEAFRQAAEDALGVPIEIIDGDTEAALVFTGVAYGGSDTERRLVVDLGGGSTECAIGSGLRPELTASIPHGHLERTRALARDGRFDADAWGRTRAEVLDAWRARCTTWGSDRGTIERAIGTGGTVRAIHKVLRARGGPATSLTAAAVKELERELVETGDVREVRYDGLSERRRRTFAGGVLCISAFLEALGLSRLEIARRGLRDGVVHDLLGHSTDISLRHRTVSRLERRYGVDTKQGDRVRALAARLARQHGGLDDEMSELLQFGARLHEMGQAVRHPGYHKEGGRLLRRSMLIGFSKDERLALAALVRLHRPGKKLKRKHWRRVSEPRRGPLRVATALLRLAVLLRRTRTDEELDVTLVAKDDLRVRLEVPFRWLREEPLLVADLEAEARRWRARDGELEVDFREA